MDWREENNVYGEVDCGEANNASVRGTCRAAMVHGT
jgi:hypothetical protein